MSIAKSEQDFAWELRTAWAKLTTVSLRLDEQCMRDRLRGRIVRVAPTGAFVMILPDGETLPWHVPCARILSVRRPHFSEPLDAIEQADDDGQIAGQMSF